MKQYINIGDIAEMNIVICDDKQDEILKIKQISQVNGINEEQIRCYTSSKELCQWLVEERPDINLFILDIEMPEISGLEVKDIIANLYEDTNIVFLTSHREVMQEAFGKQVRAFLQKNCDEDKLGSLLEEISQEETIEDFISISDGKKEVTFRKKNIVKIQAQHVYSVVTLDYFQNNQKSLSILKTETFRMSLSKWEGYLKDDSFCRVGRNVIVNLTFVKRITDEIELEKGENIKVPVRKLHDVKTAYNRYCAKVARSIL